MTKAKVDTKAKKLKEDLESVSVPFDLFTGLSLVTEELNQKKFYYSHMNTDHSPTLVFESKKLKERVSVVIEKENLLIRQFTIKEDTRKLKVLYVLKPAQRKFNLV
tara:strand:- start:101 stop:418 length:318 start_codon:yes stop_codon:yes gene_type:complete